ncbi:organic hydroperoxide resistance protein [Bradyrhizobium sp. HKCCYLS1011]|uniref:organic hydroperoxide resistance protein n=1 Tax=Bradyrhizobium sp. HKCCYLS1011 TaxID=3420733 RepID=UPI003EBA8DBE
MRPEKILYETSVTAAGGRDGKAISDDGLLSVSLSLPKSLGGSGDAGTNPEQLFAAGYAACFLGAIKLVARTRKVAPSSEPSVTAKVGMGPVPVGYALAVELKVSLPGVEKSVAEEIVAGAHERCPYSNATRGNIDVKLTVI